ncbi:MAG TPA: imidazole glycerol phosphate synthase subunit HisH [Steroidobacteraceae bacterium]|nr:imidazole glycerol phosphate synthase subunit HisH [Steroidobacteraceae bacterium]
MSAGEVVIIPSGGANIASLQYALLRLGISSAVSANARKIRAASHVILPGVGAAADAMARLRQKNLDSLLAALEQPVLGICLGMQLLFESSEEGQVRCLGVIPGRAMRFPGYAGLSVPHMGWNGLNVERESGLLEGIRQDDYVYFAHSYALNLSAATIASSVYGQSFSACVQWRNFYGVQFHPERSAAVGARLLRNFLTLGS